MTMAQLAFTTTIPAASEHGKAAAWEDWQPDPI
jgi:hypothetical protein